MRKLGLLVVTVLLAGCASMPESSGAPVPSSDSSVVARTPDANTAEATTAEAEHLWDRVGDAFIAEETGFFSQRATMKRSDGSVDTVTDGEYDLSARRWKGSLYYESDSASFHRQLPEVLRMHIDSIVVKSHVYTMNSTWKDSIRNRWLLTTIPLKGPSDPRVTWAASVGPAPMAALFGFVPTSSRPDGAGWTISGTIPARVATVALGLGIATAKAKVDLASLEGDVRMDVAVDASFLPTTLRISGEDITTVPALPKNVRTALEKSRGVTTFIRYGEPVTIVAPRASLTFTE